MYAKCSCVLLGLLACLASGAVWWASDAERMGRSGGDGSPASDPKRFSGVAAAAPAATLAGLCRERADRLPRQLARPCSTIVRPPFVLASDLSEAELQAKWQGVLQPACDTLLARYFRQLPSRPVVILMLATEAGYREAAEQLFFDRDVSRFGYYKPGRQTVLVNLAEGDGALVHELTHVLMDAGFPNAPLWLQEGLATLYEASEIRGTQAAADAPSLSGKNSRGMETMALGRQGPNLTPLPNWRGAILRRALREDRLPSIRPWIEAATFRGPGEALDYAFARSLCLFLHRRDVLARYYAALRERVGSDPMGGQTLLQVCAAGDWASLDREFRTWIDEPGNEPTTRKSPAAKGTCDILCSG